MPKQLLELLAAAGWRWLLAQGAPAAFLETLLSCFRRLGYDVDVHTALAANYRVPQLRKRIFVVGLRRELRATFTGPADTRGIRPYSTGRCFSPFNLRTCAPNLVRSAPRNAAPRLGHAPCPLALLARGRRRCPLSLYEPPTAECHDGRVRLEREGEVYSAVQ